MVELGVQERVTTFTQSEFGQTLKWNGDGTDHSRGDVQAVLGGAVQRGSICGRYPVLEIHGQDDVRDGRMIPGFVVGPVPGDAGEVVRRARVSPHRRFNEVP